MKTQTTNKSAKPIFCLVIGSLLTTASVQATETVNTNEPPRKEVSEPMSFGIGALVGAAFGGPAGAFITGLAANLLAKHSNAEDDIAELNQQITYQANKTQKLTQQYKQRLSQAEQQYQQELLAISQNYQQVSELQAQNLLMSLQFATGSSEVPFHYAEQIDALANILSQSSNLKVDLSGYTDRQGDTQFNHRLSIARSESVRQALIERGIDAERISSKGYGESVPIIADQSREASFYDRRVVIELRQDIPQVANQHY